MKMIGNEVHIQRGETWSLDFAVRNKKGHPFVILNTWKNPYVAITVTAALYEQKGDFRETYWLDLSKRWVEQKDGTIVEEPMKTFTSAEPLWLEEFTVDNILKHYGVNNGGKINTDKTSDFYIDKFLFYTDPQDDGNYVYKYINDIDDDGVITESEWIEYDFRIIKGFVTKNWMEQRYLFDIKVLAGESVTERLSGKTLQEYFVNILDENGIEYNKELTKWTDDDWTFYISQIIDENVRTEIQQMYEGAPLMPSYDTKSLLLEPTSIYVSVNIQGGVR